MTEIHLKAGKISKKQMDDAILAFNSARDQAQILVLAIKKLRNRPEKDQLLKSFERNLAPYFPDLWEMIRPKVKQKSVSELKMIEIEQKQRAKYFDAAGYRAKATECRRNADKARRDYLKLLRR